MKWKKANHIKFKESQNPLKSTNIYQKPSGSKETNQEKGKLNPRIS